MLILGDEGHYNGRIPWVTASLIVVNVLVFIAQVAIGDAFTYGWSTVPAEITTFQDFEGTKLHKVKFDAGGTRDRKGKYTPHYVTREIPVKQYAGPTPIFLTLLTSMFMHAGIFHLLGNMWILLIFGRNIECAMGYKRFLAFYIVCGLFADVAHIVSDPNSVIPCLGASGAISGVLGAYLAVHPLNNIKIWFGWLLGVIEVPAFIVIGGWFVLQYLAAALLSEEGLTGGTAYWAHIGGFVAGLVIIRVMVYHLQRQLDAEEARAEEEANTPPERDLPPPLPGSPDPASTGIAAGDPDPFATFLSVQTLRNMQEKKQTEQSSSS